MISKMFKLLLVIIAIFLMIALKSQMAASNSRQVGLLPLPAQVMLLSQKRPLAPKFILLC